MFSLDTPTLLWFMVAGWLLNLTPGPDVLCIVRQALRGGARAGMLAGLGITAGCSVHVLAAALGVGALLSTSAWAFTLLKWAGASYLFYVGLRLLWSPQAPALPLAGERTTDLLPPSGWSIWRDGFLTNVLNPKVALFFLAFVPQFIAPDSPHATRDFLGLGLLFCINALPVLAAWALTAAWLAQRAGIVQRALQRLDQAAGALFIVFGLRLVLTEQPAAPGA